MTLRERVARALYPDDYLWLDEIVCLSFTPAKVSYCPKHLEQADAAIRETLKWADGLLEAPEWIAKVHDDVRAFAGEMSSPFLEEIAISQFIAALKREAGEPAP